MKVRAVKSFSGTGFHVPEGTVFELPEGVDWLKAGLVVPVREKAVEKAVKEPREKAVTRSKRKYTRKKKKEE